LHKKFGDRVLIEHADVRSYDLNEVAPDYKLVANIPYYLTSYLIQMLSESTNPPIKAALLIQKEVAERVAAAPGAMSLLSVTAQFYWQVKLGEVVPPYLFTPPPKVNSQILILKRPAHPRYPGVQPKAYFRLVRAGFSQRRKTLLNALGSGLQASREETGALLQAAGLNPQLRPQNLSLDDWHRLYLAQAAKQLEKKA
jgi:16S rRNA (adenine1518-N6/adenine1519-N6)-dimethyltransferase